jgi:hypothetical protein
VPEHCLTDFVETRTVYTLAQELYEVFLIWLPGASIPD